MRTAACAVCSRTDCSEFEVSFVSQLGTKHLNQIFVVERGDFAQLAAPQIASVVLGGVLRRLTIRTVRSSCLTRRRGAGANRPGMR